MIELEKINSFSILFSFCSHCLLRCPLLLLIVVLTLLIVHAQVKACDRICIGKFYMSSRMACICNTHTLTPSTGEKLTRKFNKANANTKFQCSTKTNWIQNKIWIFTYIKFEWTIRLFLGDHVQCSMAQSNLFTHEHSPQCAWMQRTKLIFAFFLYFCMCFSVILGAVVELLLLSDYNFFPSSSNVDFN